MAYKDLIREIFGKEKKFIDEQELVDALPTILESDDLSKMLFMRFGLMGLEESTCDDIAEKYGDSPGMIKEYLSHSIQELRSWYKPIRRNDFSLEARKFVSDTNLISDVEENKKLLTLLSKPPSWLPSIIIQRVEQRQNGQMPYCGEQLNILVSLLKNDTHMPKAWKQLANNCIDEENLFVFLNYVVNHEYHFNLSGWAIDWEERAQKHKTVSEKANNLIDELTSSLKMYQSGTLYGYGAILFDDLNYICSRDEKEQHKPSQNYNPGLWENFYENLAGNVEYFLLLKKLKLLAESAENASLVDPCRNPKRHTHKKGQLHLNARINHLIDILVIFDDRNFNEACNLAIAEIVNTVFNVHSVESDHVSKWRSRSKK